MLLRGFMVCLLCPSLFGQYLAVAPKSPQEIGNPTRKAEAQRELKRAPLVIFNDLLSPEGAVRTRALNDLVETGLKEGAPVPDVTLRAVSLNGDGNTEYIFVLHLGLPWESFVVVANHRGESWRVVGQFKYSSQWDAETAERLVELHAPFILIRNFGGGTGVSSTVLHLYRLWNGALYEVFEMTEHASFWETRGPGIATETTDARILFRQEHFSPQAVLEVQTENRTTFRSLRQAEEKRSCQGFEWAAASFSFQPTVRATNELCRTTSH